MKKWCWLRSSEERAIEEVMLSEKREIEEVVLVKEVRGERD